jgi:hypothetical protein
VHLEDKKLKPHDVVTTIDVEDLASYAAAGVGSKEDSG